MTSKLVPPTRRRLRRTLATRRPTFSGQVFHDSYLLMRPCFAYLLSRFRPRLSLGLAALLATVPLLLAACSTSPAGRAGQGVSPETDRPGLGLSRKLPHQADFASFTTAPTSGPRSYFYIPASLYQGGGERRPRPGRYHLTLRGPGAGHASPPAGPGATGLVARSWRTIKTMFR